jgi:hypothetical protein
MPTPNRVTPQVLERIVTTYALCGSLQRTADVCGVHRMTAYKHLKRLGLVRDRPTYTARLAREAVSLYASGMSAQDVSDELRNRHGNAPNAEWVRWHVRKAGTQRSRSRASEIANKKRFGRDYDAIRKEARKLAEEKLWSVRRIALHLGVSTKMVSLAIPHEHRLGLRDALIRANWQAYVPKVERRRALQDRVIALRMGGATYPEIEAQTGVRTHTVWYWLRMCGLTRGAEE